MRHVQEVLKRKPTVEGAGVRLARVFGFSEIPKMDPFLLLDDFSSGNPADYIAGFPWHPHRGMETVTYILEGKVEHGDSLGNKGTIGSGDVQWMTAGSGIIHQEMPQEYDGFMQGFQLWVNLPREDKMMSPRYRDVLADEIPEVIVGEGIYAKIIAGEVNGVSGPVKDLVVDVTYLDIRMEGGCEFEYLTDPDHTVLSYFFEGAVFIEEEEGGYIPSGHLVRFGGGDRVRVRTGENGARFLLLCGDPLGEPIAWRGPIVMNTAEELNQAFKEVEDQTFIRQLDQSKTTPKSSPGSSLTQDEKGRVI